MCLFFNGLFVGFSLFFLFTDLLWDVKCVLIFSVNSKFYLDIAV